MSEPNSLLNMPKKQLAEQHERLVLALMRLWSVQHRMQDWRDPISAVETMYAEAKAPQSGPAHAPDGAGASNT